MFTTCDDPVLIDAKARYWSKIAIFAPFSVVPVGVYSHSAWYEKTRMVWLPDGEKNFEAMFISLLLD